MPKQILTFLALAVAATVATTARADQSIRVAYAGSMGVVMDTALGPTFATHENVQYQGQGEGAYGMARLLASRKLIADVFVSITPGPMQILKNANLIDQAMPVASTSMVIAFNPASAFAKQLEASRSARGVPWWQVLQARGLRFGRTDPAIDPQGQNIIFTVMLAERYYKQPGLTKAILGDVENPQQVLSEGGLLTRLEAGQVDASSGYESAVISAKLPYIPLPDEINLSNAAYAQSWYDSVSFPMRDPSGEEKTLKPQPLVFYAAVLNNAPDPDEARKFLDFMVSPEGQALFKQCGYGQANGTVLYR